MRAIYIGRFQPFHLGHLEIVKEILHEFDELVIGVGSAQFSHTLKNPFTAGERFYMIKRALEEEKIDLAKVYIIPIEDINRHALWVRHVETLAPSFDVVYANEPLTIRLFKEAGYEVRRTKMIQRKKYSGKNIRREIIKDGNWKQLLPKGVSIVVEEIKGDERIRDLAKTDEV